MLNFLKGFVYAINGLVTFFRYERNGRIQFGIAIVVVTLGWWFHISKYEWMALLTCIAAVLSLEMLNSALEKICNLVNPEYHPTIKSIKDISAGAVLWFAVISAIIGLIIFLPKISALL